MGESSIEWTDYTLNVTRGCELHGPGCLNCYAMRIAHRFSGPGKPYHGLTKVTDAGPIWNGEIRLYPELIDIPLRMRKPRRVFIESMSDIYHRDVPVWF